jgi:hypothetical protein
MKSLILIVKLQFTALLSLLSVYALAQSPKQIIQKVNARFATVNDYAADIEMLFDIPSVRIEKITGRVFYKKPEKFRIRTKGIVFLPKQNPYYALRELSDTTSFDAMLASPEKINGVSTVCINVIPKLSDSELLFGRFWIDADRQLVMRSQLTTKTSGTMTIDNHFGSSVSYALPDKIIFTVDMTKFKVPKAIAVDINSKASGKSFSPEKGTGQISLHFSNYSINKKLDDKVFLEED